MPFNGQGLFTRIHTWANEAASGTPILPGEFDEQEQDFASAFGNCITRDGQGGPTADIPWNNFGITGLRAPQLAGDAANKGYVDTATGARSMGGYKLTNLADPTNPQDAATMAYVGGTTTQLPAQAGNAGKALITNGAIASWKLIGTLPRSARAANAQLVSADLGSLIDITAGTFAQTFDTAANLGAGWYCYIRNSGTGNITIPASDGRTNWIMYPNEARLFVCDGANFFTLVLQAYRYTSQISGTWVKPPGYNYHHERLTGSGAGGGGGGGGASGYSIAANPGYGGSGGSGGAGGSAGVTVDAIIADSVLPNSVPFTIGAVGAGGPGGTGGAAQGPGVAGANGSNGTAGTVGNASTFGTAGLPYYISTAGGATGGQAGLAGGTAGAGGGTSATNSSTTAFGTSPTGITTLPLAAPGTSSSGISSTAPSGNNAPGGNGGNGGSGGAPAAMIAAPAVAIGGIASTVTGQAGGNGAAGAMSTVPGAGGQGGAGGGGSAGCGANANAATGKGGDGGRGADGTPGMFEITGIV